MRKRARGETGVDVTQISKRGHAVPAVALGQGEENGGGSQNRWPVSESCFNTDSVRRAREIMHESANGGKRSSTPPLRTVPMHLRTNRYA